ncbi:helix-turn-helix domain-containing protein [Parathalassolituus penaei]|uniref:AraC family transcriptional regulator n=1 Tax=Parathalassolituus penaei TaxID=2997323 RepID=A0A9X3EAU8_9GAMM|nr:AraC family transcriptional regulator [Parathalassolituus penaei]MCY0964202.1 AraC family transcriptional regulator [Parathalassolituus penaei]
MMQRFARASTRWKPEIEQRAELMYMCKAEVNYTRLLRAMHMHEDRVEVVLIREGSGTHLIDGRPYNTRQGDLLVYNAGVLHDESATPDGGMAVYCCGFRGLRLKGLPANFLVAGGEAAVFATGALFDECASLMEILYEHADTSSARRLSFCNQLLQALILLLLEVVGDDQNARLSATPDTGIRIKQFIDDHYREPLDLKSMAASLGMSHFHLARQFRATTGYSPIQYLIRRRIGEAQSLLISTRLSVTDIALRVGYDNSNYFHSAFRKVVGVTPGDYRRLCISETDTDPDPA